MPKYVATFRAVFDADDDVRAAVISDQIELNAKADLDEDEGDEFECTQVTSNGLELRPEELRVLLRKARNALLKTKWRPCYDLARDLDKIVFALKHSDDPSYTMGGYDYSKFVDLAERIIRMGEEPDVGTDD